MEQNKDQGGAAVRGEAVAEFAYKGADGKFLDSGAWWVENSEISCHMALPILRNGEVIAMVFAEAVDGCRETIEENCRLLCGVANSTAPVAASEPTELIELLRSIRPNYGAVGSRDVDVSAMRKKIDAAITILSARAADAPSEPNELAKRLRGHASLFKVGCEPYVDVLAAADALDSQPTDDGKFLYAMEFEAVELGYAGLAEAMAALRRMKADPDADREALIACLGDDAATLSHINPDDEMAQTMHDAIAMLESDEVIIATLGMASSQPTDGGVRNG